MIENAKATSYENIENARAKRATKEEAIPGKVKRGRKRKIPAPETEKAKKVQGNEMEIAKNEIVIIEIENHCSILQLRYVTVQ
jgi:hypothetical protein